MIETETQIESVFISTVKRCPIKAVGVRAVLELLDRFLPGTQPDEDLREVGGQFLAAAPSYTVLRILRSHLGPIHPFIAEFQHTMREEWKR